jgi:hypothetical protein
MTRMTAKSHYAARRADLLEAAQKATGLTDFGKDDFLEGLDLFLHCLDHGPSLSPAGEAMTFGQLQMFLESRLYSEEGWKRHPDAAQKPLAAPLIITGIVRSGTTALHRLMSIDPQFQGLEHWLAWAPQPRPPRPQWPDIPAYRKVTAVMESMIASAPELRDDHMMSADGVEESMFLLPQTFCNNTFPAQWHVPAYDAWYLAQDETPSYRRLAKNLALIGANDPDKRWLLKNPADLRAMDAVLNVHPDAMIVQTHRDPIQSIPSVANLIFAAQRMFAGDAANPHNVGQRETAFWADAVKRGAAARHRTKKPVFDLEFADFVRDQMGAVRAIYAYFSLELRPEVDRQMQSWLAAHPRKSTSMQRFTPEDFGVKTGEMRTLYADYRAGRGYA